MSGKTISHPGGEWKLRVLLYLICFVLPVAWMLRTEDAFGMETDTDCTFFLYMCGSNLESESGSLPRTSRSFWRRRSRIR